MACTLAGWSASVHGDLPQAVCSCSVATANRRATGTAPGMAEMIARCFSAPLQKVSVLRSLLQQRRELDVGILH